MWARVSKRPWTRRGVPFDDVSVGRYRIEVWGEPFIPAGLSLRVGPGDRCWPRYSAAGCVGATTPIRDGREGVARLQGVSNDAGHGDIFVELVDGQSATTTLADGYFRILVVAGTPSIRLSKVGYGSVVVPVGEVAERTTVVLPEAVVLSAQPGRVAGQVRLAQFATPARVQRIDVTLYSEDDEAISAVQPDANGRFVFDEVGLGTWRIEASRPAYQTQSVVVTVGPAEQVNAGELVLAHESQTENAVRLSGRITLADKDDHRGTSVDVRIMPEGLSQALLVTDADGGFEVVASPADRYLLTVRRPRYAVPETGGLCLRPG